MHQRCSWPRQTPCTRFEAGNDFKINIKNKILSFQGNANHDDQTSLRAFCHPQAMEKWAIGSTPFDEKYDHDVFHDW